MKYDAVIVGGGIAGLSMAAILSTKNKKVCLIEKSILGGRGITLDMKGFKYNFGAHAVYGLDQSIWSKLQKDLNLNVEWNHYDPKRTYYYKNEKLFVMPSNMDTFFETKLLKFKDKIHFIKLVLKIMRTTEIQDETLAQWLSNQKISQLTKDTFLHLVSSNFFTSKPKEISMKVLIPYYKRLFLSQTGVSYIKGGWGSLISELEDIILNNNGVIITKDSVKEVEKETNIITKLRTNKGEEVTAETYIFAIPPKELNKLFGEGWTEEELHSLESGEVMFFDVGLSEKINTDHSYIKDWDSKIFLTDVSHYDDSLTPEGGQMIQMIAYINKDVSKEEKDEIEEKMKSLLTKFFPGWEEKVVTKRQSKKAAIQEISPIHNKGLKITKPDIQNGYFIGEWTDVPGSLSEKSIQSVYECLKHMNEK